MSVNQWDILDFMKDHKKEWFTAKELILKMGLEITKTEMVKQSRKLRGLYKSDYISKRICERSISWRPEDEYKYKR